MGWILDKNENRLTYSPSVTLGSYVSHVNKGQISVRRCIGRSHGIEPVDDMEHRVEIHSQESRHNT